MQNNQSALRANPGKKLTITATDGNQYDRFALRTHFVRQGENYDQLVENYVLPYYRSGDILCLGEKVVSICQGNVLDKGEVEPSWLSRQMAKYVEQTSAGTALGDPYKMQTAVKLVGWPRIFVAAAASVIGKKIFRQKGWFYVVAGREVAGIDGVCADAFQEYLEILILNPSRPNEFCQRLWGKYGIDCVIVDANDYGVEILGTSKSLEDKRKVLKSMIMDNPAGQSNQQTPLILIRKTES